MSVRIRPGARGATIRDRPVTCGNIPTKGDGRQMAIALVCPSAETAGMRREAVYRGPSDGNPLSLSGADATPIAGTRRGKRPFGGVRTIAAVPPASARAYALTLRILAGAGRPARVRAGGPGARGRVRPTAGPVGGRKKFGRTRNQRAGSIVQCSPRTSGPGGTWSRARCPGPGRAVPVDGPPKANALGQ